MTQVNAQLPDELVAEMDQAAQRLHQSRSRLIQQALENYLDDLEDLSSALERLRDPEDPVLDWEDVKRDLLRQD